VEGDRADAGVAAEERALRAAQHLDAFHVEHGADDRAHARNVGAVEEDGDAWLDRRVARRADAANGEAHVGRLRTLCDAEVRSDLRQAFDVDHIVPLERVARKSGNGDRNVLNVLGALLRGNDDLRVVAGGGRSVGFRCLRCIGCSRFRCLRRLILRHGGRCTEPERQRRRAREREQMLTMIHVGPLPDSGMEA
jgi:hypothetical protein